MRYQCSLNNIEFFAHHGNYPEERKTGGTFIVSVSVEMNKEKKGLLVSLDEVVNYEELFMIVERIMKEPENLIETVAGKILDSVEAISSQASRVEVKIEKVNPAGLLKSANAVVVLSRNYE